MANILLSDTHEENVSELYEKSLDVLDDNELVQLVKQRQDQPLVDVDIDQYL